MKKIFALLALFAFSLSFVACSTTDQDETSELYDTFSPDPEVELPPKKD